MMTRPRLHIHSDCDFFGGCESMLVNFFNDPRLQKGYALSFSYRSVPAYVEGLRNRLAPLPQERGLQLLSESAPGAWARKLPPLLALPLLALQSLLLLRYWILACNVVLLLRAWRGKKIDLLHINNGILKYTIQVNLKFRTIISYSNLFNTIIWNTINGNRESSGYIIPKELHTGCTLYIV